MDRTPRADRAQLSSCGYISEGRIPSTPSAVATMELRVVHASAYVGLGLRTSLPPFPRLVLIYLGAECVDEGVIADFDLNAFCSENELDEALVAASLDLLCEVRALYRGLSGLVVFPEHLSDDECEALFNRSRATPADYVPAYRSKADLKRRALAAFDHCCAYCERPGTADADPDGYAWQLDRIHPGSKGGEYLAGNVALACRICNQEKRARTDWDTATVCLADLEAAGE